MIAARDALRWVLDSERMAFPATRERMATEQLKIGDSLFLYTTRGAFGNPGRDMGRVICEARITTDAARLRSPILLAGRTFTTACSVSIEQLVPFGSGVIVANYVNQMDAFPVPHAWSTRLRTALREISPRDAALLRRKLKELPAPEDAAKTY